ncbi:MAG: DUF4253 domain-containing protein [Alphaproteobacteria bacterium]|nr:DUF4253 domain-containing protein [Alphaproteobacteria bacterium]
MLRRQFLGGGLAGVLLRAWSARATTVYSAKGLKIDPPGGNAGEIERKERALRARALAAFPYPRVEAEGRDAFATWHLLKTQDRGVPVVVGGDDDLARIAEALLPSRKPRRPEAILAAADKLNFPDDLAALRRREAQEAHAAALKAWRDHPDDPGFTITELDETGEQRTLSKADTWQRLLAPPPEPALGEWPAAAAAPQQGLSVVRDVPTGKLLDKVHIVLLPAGDWTEAPALLNWGGWNGCPPPEYHVAALRSWRQRYGAELVGMGGDALNLTVARRPLSRDEALALAREHYLYCSDAVDQTLRPLALHLMSDDWWSFWWD